MSARSILQTSRHWKSYTALGADIPFLADGPATANDKLKLHPREILVVSGGIIKLTRPDGTVDASPDLPAGTFLPCQATSFVAAGSTATSIMVFW